MKDKPNRLKSRVQNHPFYAKTLGWGKLVSLTGGAQIIIQALGMLSGIIIIRLLSVEEYAYYTLTNTMLGTMIVLADSGISAGVMAEGGKVWNSKENMGKVIVTGLDLRKKFAIGSLLLSLPILCYLLNDNHASLSTIVLIVLTLIPAFIAALSDSLYQIPLKLKQQVIPLQKNQLGVGSARLLLISLSLFFWPLTFVAILCNGLPRFVGNIRLRKLSSPLLNYDAKIDKQVRSNILKVVKNILPGAIYYCISGQITVWLISIFGETSSIADIGALGRINMVFSVFAMLASTLFVPRFARLPKTLGKLLKGYLSTIFFLVICLSSTVAILTIFSTNILFILGEEYTGLSSELRLSVIAGAIGVFGGVLFTLNSSRGWVPNPILLIGSNLAGILVCIYFLKLNNLTQVLLMSIILNLIGFGLNLSYGLFSIKTKIDAPI